MPEPISSTSQTPNYTPVDPEGDDGGMCVAPLESTAADSSEETAPEPKIVIKTTYGDGKIHREGIGFRVDPSSTTTIKTKAYDLDIEGTVTGVETLVAGSTKGADGSTGARLGVSANLIQGTLTAKDGTGDEVTIGAGIGVGTDVSSGDRDVDGDGNEEYCLRASAFFWVAGFCSEAIGAAKKGLGL